MGCTKADRRSSDTANSSNRPQPGACKCNISPGNEHFSYQDFPPPAAPNGREDLWELQFCRWWGWNWVRKRSTEAKIAEKSTSKPSNRNVEITAESSHMNRPKMEEQKRVPTMPQTKTCQCRHRATTGQKSRQSPLPTKHELKSLCKCLMFKKPSQNLPPQEMQNLYNTPSHSAVVLQKCSYGVAEKDTESYMEAKESSYSRREKQKDKCRQIQSWCKDLSSSSEDEITKRVSCHKQRSTTEESMEYLSVRLQHVKSDMCCFCQKHSPPERDVTEKKPTLETQTVTETLIREDKEIQAGKISCTNDVVEKIIQYNGKKKKTLCIMVCCCGCCQKNGCAAGVESTKVSKSCIKKLPDEVRNPTDPLASYQVSVEPFKKKSFSKFGTPSKNYPWLQNNQSNDTTNTLQENNSYKSPHTGKTYNLDTLTYEDNDNSNTLPDLIDISEDLSYLKEIESVSKSDVEHRILLDAVCDAILSEHAKFKGCASKLINEITYANENVFNRNTNSGNNVEANTSKQEFTHTASTTSLTALITGANYEDNLDVIVDKLLSNTTDEDATSREKSRIKIDLEPNQQNGVADTSVSTHKESTLKNIVEKKAADSGKDIFKFKSTERAEFTKTGLLPASHIPVFRAQPKRAAEFSPRDSVESKKLKQEDLVKSPVLEESSQERFNKISCDYDNIFHKIDKIVASSKVKGAEIQKALTSCDNMDNGSVHNFKQNYEMSTNRFNEIIKDTSYWSEIEKKKCYEIFSETPEISEKFQISEDINKKSDIKENNLGINSFVIINQKSSNDGNVPGKKESSKKRGIRRTSLIPVRKKRKTNKAKNTS